jgi:hypothetical protein
MTPPFFVYFEIIGDLLPSLFRALFPSNVPFPQKVDNDLLCLWEPDPNIYVAELKLIVNGEKSKIEEKSYVKIKEIGYFYGNGNKKMTADIYNPVYISSIVENATADILTITYDLGLNYLKIIFFLCCVAEKIT